VPGGCPHQQHHPEGQLRRLLQQLHELRYILQCDSLTPPLLLLGNALEHFPTLCIRPVLLSCTASCQPHPGGLLSTARAWPCMMSHHLLCLVLLGCRVWGVVTCFDVKLPLQPACCISHGTALCFIRA